MLPIINRHLIFPLIELIREEPISKCLSDLKKSQRYSYDELRSLQWRKLKILLHHCYNNIPFYREIFDDMKLLPEDIKDLEDFKKLPLLTKDHLRTSQRELIDKTFKRKVEHCHSGGTLGRPLNFIRDSLSAAFIRAAQFRGFGWHGIKIGDRQVRFWGFPLDQKLTRKEKRKDFLVNRRRISPFEIRRKTVFDYYKTINSFKPRYIYGYPSTIFKMCQLMDEQRLNGEKLNVRHIVTTAETLYSQQRQFIESFFNCRVVNEYGCSEMGPIACECEEGNLHINMENVLVEFIENDRYSKDNAEIIMTNLNNFSMPLLRYQIGDTGTLLNSKCSCGRNLEIMGFNAGRIVGSLTATDGHFVFGGVFCYIAFDLIEKYGGIKDFRVIQKEKDRIEITLSKDTNYSDEILHLFESKIKELLGSDIRIDYKFMDEIPLEASGKRLFVYSELNEESHSKDL